MIIRFTGAVHIQIKSQKIDPDLETVLPRFKENKMVTNASFCC